MPRNHAFYAYLHVALITFAGTSRYRSEFFNRKDLSEDVAIPDLIQTFQNVSSIIVCALSCGNEGSCNSYSYHLSERVCVLYRGINCGIDDIEEVSFYVRRDLTISECNTDEFAYNEDVGLCYFISMFKAYHDEAVDSCNERGAHLLLIDSDDIRNFVLSLLPAGGVFWIDGERSSPLSNTWKDYQGRDMTYFYWFPWEPGSSEPYIEIYDNSGSGTQWGWNDKDNRGFSRFICQIDL